MSETQVSLQEVLHISEAKMLQEQLLEALNSGNELIIDASSVERADTASIQLLLAAKQSFEKESIRFTIADASDSLKKNISSLGLSAAFDY